MRDAALSSPHFSLRLSATTLAKKFVPILALTTTISATSSAQTGLVAAYGFNEASGTTTADASGNNNTGTLGSGVTRTTSGKFGSALVFSGNYVTVPHAASLNLTTAMTLEAWVYPTSGGNWATAVMKEQSGEFVYSLYADAPATPGAYFNIGTNASTERSINGPSTLALNTWTHLAETFDGATLRLYVNGTQVASQAFSGPIATSTGALRIGGNGVWGEYFHGRIDEVRVYNRALSASELATDMATAVGPVGPDVTVPSVAITGPTSNPTYATSTTPLTVSGTASDNVGVTTVTWTNDRGGSGTATGTTSWSASGIALQTGVNVLTVTAKDAANNVATTTLTVTYTAPDGTLPTVAITSPSSTGSYTASTSPIALSGTASDNVGVTQVTWANDRGGAGTASGTTNWSVSAVALQPGVNVVTVTAKDAANNTKTATLTVTYNAPDVTAPTLAITSPTGSGTYLTNASSLTVSGTASDNVGVTQVSWANSAGGAGTASGTTSWSASGIALQAGANTVTVTARDAANNVATANLLITRDVAPPSVSVTSPLDGNTVSGSITVSATAHDAIGMAGVTVLVDGFAAGAEVLGPGPSYSLLWNSSTSENGPHQLAVSARDDAGNVAVSTPISVTVNNVVSSGLVAAYGFNETSGTSTADASGLNNTGTIGAGVTRTATGRFGGALNFAGGYVTVPHSPALNLTTGMTLEAWVNPIASGTWATVVMKEQPGEFVYSLYADAPAYPGAYFNVGASSSTEHSINATSPLPLATWTHLAQTFDGATLRLYVNGVNVASQAYTGPIATSTGVLRIGGNGVWGEFFSGQIDEVRIYDRALSASEILTDMNTAVGEAPAPDTVPPSVAVTAPAAGASVSGLVMLTATASDNYGIAGVRFIVDGTPIENELSVPPYSAPWDASNVSVGQHSIQASARDFNGNTTLSAPIQVTVTPSQASVVGQWSAPFAWPIVGLHTALLKTGEVITWEYDGAGGPWLWNYQTGQFTSVPQTLNLFCAGQAALPDGRFLIAGGHIGAHVGINNTTIFDPVTKTWQLGPTMYAGRWYPTVTGLPDGRALIMSGETTCDGCNALIPEIYNPATNTLTKLNSASQNFPYYPHNYVLPDGRIFVAASAEAPIVSKVLDLTTNSWSTVDPSPVDGGSSVMYLPGKIMKSGTSHNPDLPPDPSFATTYVIDMTAASPKWVQTAPMAHPRTYHNLTLLPDGNVLVTGGGTTTDAISPAGAVYQAELWSPTTKTYTPLASGQVPRLYHSTALLLPDGRVLVGAGGRFNGYPSNDVSDRTSAEIFSPPYLFKGPRPTITSAPASSTYGATISVQTPDAANIVKVSLIRLASVTHAFNTDQRFLPLTFTVSGNQLNVEMPANANLAPPGHYMIFILDGNGVPSVASMIQIQ